MSSVPSKLLSHNAPSVVSLSPRLAAHQVRRAKPRVVMGASAADGAPSESVPSSLKALSPFVGKYGLAAAMTDDALAKAFLTTDYVVPLGKPTDQKQSGRCWIFSGLNMLRQRVLAAYGPEFQYSQNYIAYWDKFERANAYFDKMIELSHEPRDGQRVLNLVENLYTDGGEWELFRNVVLKHGVVPNYAMPETEMAGQSEQYMALLRRRVREIGGLLHKGGAEGATHERLHEIKERGLREVRGILNAFLGEPPSEFLWREPALGEAAKLRRTPADSCIVQLTPLEMLAKNPCKLQDMVHVTNFPNHPLNSRLQVDDVNNVVGAPGMEGLNVSMDVLKEVARASLKAGQPILVSSEVQSRDRGHDVWALHGDRSHELLGIDAGLRLSKGDRLDYRVTGVAHGMLFTGCDDPSKQKYNGAPLHGAQAELVGPLWRVENSWKDHDTMFMTDAWVDEYVYAVVVDKAYLPAAAQELLASADTPQVHVPAWDPFGRV